VAIFEDGSALQCPPALTWPDAHERALAAVEGFVPYANHAERTLAIIEKLENFERSWLNGALIPVHEFELPAQVGLMRLIQGWAHSMEIVREPPIEGSGTEYAERLIFHPDVPVTRGTQVLTGADAVRHALHATYRDLEGAIATLKACTLEIEELERDPVAAPALRTRSWEHLRRLHACMTLVVRNSAVELSADDLIWVVAGFQRSSSGMVAQLAYLDPVPAGWRDQKVGEFMASNAKGKAIRTRLRTFRSKMIRTAPQEMKDDLMAAVEREMALV